MKVLREIGGGHLLLWVPPKGTRQKKGWLLWASSRGIRGQQLTPAHLEARRMKEVQLTPWEVSRKWQESQTFKGFGCISKAVSTQLRRATMQYLINVATGEVVERVADLLSPRTTPVGTVATILDTKGLEQLGAKHKGLLLKIFNGLVSEENQVARFYNQEEGAKTVMALLEASNPKEDEVKCSTLTKAAPKAPRTAATTGKGRPPRFKETTWIYPADGAKFQRHSFKGQLAAMVPEEGILFPALVKAAEDILDPTQVVALLSKMDTSGQLVVSQEKRAEPKPVELPGDDPKREAACCPRCDGTGLVIGADEYCNCFAGGRMRQAGQRHLAERKEKRSGK